MNRKTISYEGQIVFERVVLPSRFKRFPKVFQQDEACFIYMDKGAFAFRTPNRLLEIHQGEALVAKCGNYFVEPIQDQSTHTITIVGAYFYPEMVKTFFRTDLGLVEFRENFDVNQLSTEPLLTSFIASVNYLLENPELADKNLILNKLKELLILIGRTEKSMQDYVDALFTPYNYDFTSIIENNLYTHMSLDEWAKLCGVSLSTFKRRFRKQYSQSPAEYFRCKKLARATELLAVENLPIATIAYECGFEHATSFNKVFKRYVGQSPTQVRKNRMDKKMSS